MLLTVFEFFLPWFLPDSRTYLVRKINLSFILNENRLKIAIPFKLGTAFYFNKI